MKPKILFLVLLVLMMGSLGLLMTPGIYKNGQGTSPSGELNPPGEWHAYTAGATSGWDSKGYDFFSVFDYRRVFHGELYSAKYHTGQSVFEFLLDAEKNILRVTCNKKIAGEFFLSPLLEALAKNPSKTTSLPSSKLTLHSQDGRVRLYIENISALLTPAKDWKLYFLKVFVLGKISS